MALTAKFPGATFERTVTGYRISACLFPGTGFNGHFYVYVCVRADPRTSPGLVTFEEEVVPRGTLQITEGPGIELTFSNIDLIAVDAFANHAERKRVLEFQYDRDVSDTDTFKPVVDNKSSRKIERSRLGPDFRFSLGGAEENLLAFTSHQTPDKGSAFRFCSLANSQGNSWLKKILAFKSDWKDFIIPVGDMRVKVTRDTVDRIYIDESYGDMLRVPLAGLGSVIRARGDNRDIARFESDASTASQLLACQQSGSVDFNADPDVVQTATFVFKHGATSKLAVR